jgi:hypothetical protein
MDFGRICLGAVRDGNAHTEAGVTYDAMGDGNVDPAEAGDSVTWSRALPDVCVMLTPIRSHTLHPKSST